MTGQIDAERDCLLRMKSAAVALDLDPGLAPMFMADAAVIWPVVTLLQADTSPLPPVRVQDGEMILALQDFEREIRRFLCQSVIDAPARTPAGRHAKRRLIRHLELTPDAAELFREELASWIRALRDSALLDEARKSGKTEFAR